MTVVAAGYSAHLATTSTAERARERWAASTGRACACMLPLAVPTAKRGVVGAMCETSVGGWVCRVEDGLMVGLRLREGVDVGALAGAIVGAEQVGLTYGI